MNVIDEGIMETTKTIIKIFVGVHLDIRKIGKKILKNKEDQLYKITQPILTKATKKLIGDFPQVLEESIVDEIIDTGKDVYGILRNVIKAVYYMFKTIVYEIFFVGLYDFIKRVYNHLNIKKITMLIFQIVLGYWLTKIAARINHNNLRTMKRNIYDPTNIFLTSLGVGICEEIIKFMSVYFGFNISSYMFGLNEFVLYLSKFKYTTEKFIPVLKKSLSTPDGRLKIVERMPPLLWHLATTKMYIEAKKKGNTEMAYTLFSNIVLHTFIDFSALSYKVTNKLNINMYEITKKEYPMYHKILDLMYKCAYIDSKIEKIIKRILEFFVGEVSKNKTQ